MHAWTARAVGQAVGAVGPLIIGLGVAQAAENHVLQAVPGAAVIAVEIPPSPGPTASVPPSDVWTEVVVGRARPVAGAQPVRGNFDRTDRPGGKDRVPYDLGIDDPARLKVRAEPRRLPRR